MYQISTSNFFESEFDGSLIKRVIVGNSLTVKTDNYLQKIDRDYTWMCNNVRFLEDTSQKITNDSYVLPKKCIYCAY